jgi:hypothetical protein
VDAFQAALGLNSFNKEAAEALETITFRSSVEGGGIGGMESALAGEGEPLAGVEDAAQGRDMTTV